MGAHPWAFGARLLQGEARRATGLVAKFAVDLFIGEETSNRQTIHHPIVPAISRESGPSDNG
jgi:hypothetical protein